MILAVQRPAPARYPVGKRPMPAGSMNTSMGDVKRMRTTPAVMPAVTPASTASAASSVQTQQKHACAVLNLYKPGLVYQVIGERGLPHSKTFTVELIVDEQVGKIKCFISTFLLYADIIVKIIFAYMRKQYMCEGRSISS